VTGRPFFTGSGSPQAVAKRRERAGQSPTAPSRLRTSRNFLSGGSSPPIDWRAHGMDRDARASRIEARHPLKALTMLRMVFMRARVPGNDPGILGDFSAEIEDVS